MIRIANAPCSWGVLEFELEGEAAGFAQVLDEMKATGYEGTELGDWGFMPSEPGPLRAELDKRGLQLLGAFVPVSLADPAALREGIDTAVRTASLMADSGFPEAFLVLADNNGTVPERTLNAGRITPEMSLSPGEWEIFASGATSLAEEVRKETGLRTAFHHHCGGHVETPEEIAIFLGRTDPGLLGLVFDTGHYRFGGGDPMEGLSRFRERIWHVHFKDCDEVTALESRKKKWDYFESVRAGVFCELGKGSVDFPSITSELKAGGYEGWIVVEQDVLPGMGDPMNCAHRNRRYLEKLGL